MYKKNLIKKISTVMTAAVMTFSVAASSVLNIKNNTKLKTSAVMTYTDQYDDFLKVLGNFESGNRYAIRGGSYYGRWQLGRYALIDAGFMTSSGAWTTLAAKFGVTSVDTFLTHPLAQDYAVYKSHRKNWAYLTSNGATKYLGTTFKGVKVTVAALVGGAHLVGAYGLKNMLVSGTIATDSAGTSALKYMSALGSYNIEKTILGNEITADAAINNNAVAPEATTAAVTEAPTAGAVVTTDGQTTKVEPTTTTAPKKQPDPLTEEQLKCIKENGDYDKDGNVTSKDAVMALVYYANSLVGDDSTFAEFTEEYMANKQLTENTTSEETTLDTANATGNVSALEVNNDITEVTESNTENNVSGTAYGDLNADGKINAKEATLILRYYAYCLVNGNVTLTTEPAETTEEKVEETSEDIATTEATEKGSTTTETAAAEKTTQAVTDVSKNAE